MSDSSTSTTATTSTERIKRCRVCGDKALSFNFSGLSCESCKIFFRRHAHKDAELRCFEQGNCPIDVQTRKNCQRCRLDKCLSIGMRKDMIISRAQKNGASSSHSTSLAHLSIRSVKSTSRQVKSHLLADLLMEGVDGGEETRQIYRESEQANCERIGQTAEVVSVKSEEDEEQQSEDEEESEEGEIQALAPYDTACLEVIKKVTLIFAEPPTEQINVVGYVNDLVQVFNKQEFQIQNLIQFTKSIEGFQVLNQTDQLTLFKTAFPEILFLRTAYFFNLEKNAFLVRLSHKLDNAAYVKLETIYGQQLQHHQLHRKLAFMVRDEVEQDLIIRDLICVLLIFKPNDNVAYPEFLRYQFALYSTLLRKYLRHKFADNPLLASRRHGAILKMISKIGPMKAALLPTLTRDVDASQVSHVLNEIYYLQNQQPAHSSSGSLLQLT